MFPIEAACMQRPFFIILTLAVMSGDAATVSQKEDAVTVLSEERDSLYDDCFYNYSHFSIFVNVIIMFYSCVPLF